MASDPNLPFEQAPYHSIAEQKTRLWALSYEQKSKLICCENCGTTTSVRHLAANHEAVPEHRLDPLQPAPAVEDCCPPGAAEQLIDGRYRIIRTLGKGGMGSVYLVHDQVLDKPMAIKMLRDDLTGPAGGHVRRFDQEAKSALAMTHVNVVAAYSQGHNHAGAPYLVMDYIEGESLAALIDRQGVLEISQALGIFMQVCDALSHAHTKNLIHRDIKPANVLLKPIEGEGLLVKLVDFGIAKTLPLFDMETHALTQTGEIVGSPSYMSPERCQGEDADERSDIYSLGCVMYEALTGKPPFKAKNPVMAIVQHIKSVPETLTYKIRITDSPFMPEGFDFGAFRRAVDAVVLRCLEKDPACRYQSADALRLDLEALSRYDLPRDTGSEGVFILRRGERKKAEKAILQAVPKTVPKTILKAAPKAVPAPASLTGGAGEAGRPEAAIALMMLFVLLIALLIGRAF